MSDTQSLSPEEIHSLKELERRNRDAGALSSAGEYVSEESAVEVAREGSLLRRRLGARAAWTLLDAGCGNGRYALDFAARVKRVVAVDFSGASIDRLRSQAEAQGLTNIEGIVSDLCSLDLPPASVDGAISVEVIQHIPGDEERQRALEAIARALKPGAPLVLSGIAWNRRAERPRDGFWGTGERRIWRHHFERHELESLFERSGFGHVGSTHFHALPRRVLRKMPRWTAGAAPAFDCVARPFGIGTHIMVWGKRR